MGLLSALATQKLHGSLTGETGLNMFVDHYNTNSTGPLPLLGEEQIVMQYIGVEVAEKRPVKYPIIYVYCERLTHDLREKFRAVSAKCRLAAEVRVSQDRIDGLEAQAQCYADAVCQVLDHQRGDWGSGVYYGGGYEVTFHAVRSGGRNYLQVAKITLEVDICKE